MEGLVREGREIFIAPPTPTVAITQISEVRRQGDSLAVRFRGVDTGWQARKLVGRKIQARMGEEVRSTGGRGVVGLAAVFDNGEACGVVSDILELKPPAPPVLVIAGNRRELLVPLVDEYAIVDVDNERVVVMKSAFVEQLNEGAERPPSTFTSRQFFRNSSRLRFLSVSRESRSSESSLCFTSTSCGIILQTGTARWTIARSVGDREW